MLKGKIGIAVQLLTGLIILAVMPIIEFLNLDEEYNNCWYYAVTQWIKYGGFVVGAESKYGWWAHYSHTFDFIRFSEFTTSVKYTRRFPPPIYHGYINDYNREHQVNK